MENSINFLHPLDTIKSSTDGKLFRKNSNKWEEVDGILYKSEKKLPTSEIGNNGDFYAKYYRKYNYFLYSEDFTQNAWNKNHCNLNKESTIVFPYNPATKMTATVENTEHSMEYLFYNELRTPYTFSLYVRKNEIRHIALMLSEQDEKYGYVIKVNLINNTFTQSQFGTTSDIKNASANIEKIDDNVVRIWVTAQFNTTLILKAAIKLMNENNNYIFSVPNETYGLFINGAQLVESIKPEEYILSNGKYATALMLQQLYNKINNNWSEINNTILYLNKEPTSTVGNNGDLACMDSIIKLNPLILFGNSENINRWKRPIGTLHYNKNKDKWYVTTKKGDYSLVFVNPKPNYSGAALAITLNQQIYQTYERYGRPSHFKGFNTGGNYNFWIRNTKHSRL